MTKVQTQCFVMGEKILGSIIQQKYGPEEGSLFTLVTPPAGAVPLGATTTLAAAPAPPEATSH